MPPVSKQPAQPQFASGSLLAGAVPVSSLREDRVKVCIYGRNRSGKTTLAAQFPKPILVISSEPGATGGATSIATTEGVSLIRVSSKRMVDPTTKLPEKVYGSAKVVGIANELAQANPFATVILDTITSLQDVILVEFMGLSKVPEMLSWGFVPDGVYQNRAEKLRETVRPILELENCNVVILAQEKDHNASEDRSGRSKLMHTMQQGSFMAPSLGSTNAEWLETNCGYVIQIYEDELQQEVSIPRAGAPPITQRVGTGKRQRHLRLLYHPNFAAGGRWVFERGTPEFVTAPTPRELYEAMARYVPSLKV